MIGKVLRGLSRAGLLACGMHMCAATAWAGDAMDLEAARRLLAAGEAEKAAALLEQDLSRYAGNAEYDYLLGQAWYQAGQPGKALFAFERVVMADPGNVDARLKAARINLERGGAGFAEELLAPLADQRLGTEQQRQIERLRAEVAAGRAGGSTLRGYVLAGIGWDDNVTSGPDQSSLDIPSQGVTDIGTAARAGDRVGMVEAGLSWRKALDEDTWLSGGGSLRQGFNRGREDVKESVASLDLGLLRRVGGEHFGLVLLAQGYLLSDTLYRETLGARVNWAHLLDGQDQVNSYIQYLNFDYPGHAIDNAERLIVGVTRESNSAGGNWMVQYGVYAGEEDATDPDKPHFDFRLAGVHVGGSLILNSDWTLSAGLVYEWRRHPSEDALYLFKRHDNQFSLGLAADYRLGGDWHLIPQYTYTHNDSNTELYEYSRNTFMLQLRWDFDR